MDDIYKTILTENSKGVIYSIENYIIRFDSKNYEVLRYNIEYYTHIRNYNKLSEAIKRVAEELEKEGK